MSEDKKQKMRATRFFCLAMAILLIASIFIWGFQSSWGQVEIKRLTLTTPDGEALSTLVYIPSNATVETPAPAVVIYHGRSNQGHSNDTWSMELARRGYVVFSPDLTGGGESHTYPSTDGYGGALSSSSGQNSSDGNGSGASSGKTSDGSTEAASSTEKTASSGEATTTAEKESSSDEATTTAEKGSSSGEATTTAEKGSSSGEATTTAEKGSSSGNAASSGTGNGAAANAVSTDNRTAQGLAV